MRDPKSAASDVTSLGGAGLRAFMNIAEAWGLTVAEQLKLLGIASRSTFFKWRRERNPRLPRDTLERLSYLLGIYKSLQILLPDPQLADQWVRKPNTAPHLSVAGRPSTACCPARWPTSTSCGNTSTPSAADSRRTSQGTKDG